MNYTKTFFCTLGVFTLLFLGSTSFMIGTGIETEDTPIHFADENLLNSTAATNNVMIPDSGYSPKPDDETIVPKDRILTVKGYDTCEMERPGRIQISKKTAHFAGLNPFKIYVVNKYVVTKKVRIYSTYEIFKPMSSPGCGLTADGNWSSNEWYQGYQYESKFIPDTFSKETTMTTWIFHVICENDGTNIGNDVWIPCKKEDLTWVYQEWATISK